MVHDASSSSSGPPDEDAGAELRLARALGEFTDLVGSGEEVDTGEFLARYPDLAPRLEEAIRTLRRLGPYENPGAPESHLGDYRILREIGRGGMGIVHEALQLSLERRVALKVLPASLLVDPKAVTRFQREARIAAKLHHDNIVEVYGMGIDDGVPYFAMEFVEGRTLRQLLQAPEGAKDGASGSGLALATPRGASMISRFASAETWTGDGTLWSSREDHDEPSTAGEPPADPTGGNGAPGIRPEHLDFRRIAEAFAGVADGLHHAHKLGIVHRDLKPSNLILDRAGRLRILDFGLARVEGQEHLTLSKESLGTPLYMSPEQAQPSRAPIGAGTDVYSLGVTLYEVLAGRTPFGGRTVHHTLGQIVHRDPPPLRKLDPQIPRDLETIVLKCLRKSPGERYATAEALAQDLRRCARGEPVEARSYTIGEKLVRRAWRNKAKVAVAATLVLLLGALSWLGWGHRRHAAQVRAERYEQNVVQSVMKMQHGLLQRRVRPRRPIVGGYMEGFFVPAGNIYEDPAAFQAAVRKAGRDPVGAAVDELAEAQKDLPGRPDAYYHRAKGLLLMGRDGEALDELGRAMERDSGFVPALILRAAILEKAGDLQGARSEMDRAGRAAQSGWPEAWLAAHRAAEKGNWKEAVAAYGKLLKLLDVSEPYLGSSVETLLGRGAALLELDQIDLALVDFAHMMGKWPGQIEPVLLIGKAHILDDREEAGRGTFEDLHSQAAMKDEVALRLVGIYESLGDNQSALGWAKRIQDEHERERQSAVCLIRLGGWEDACRSARRAIELRPGDALSHLWLGLALHIGEKSAEAEKVLLEAIRLAPKITMGQVLLGDALAKRGRLDDAIAKYEEASGIDSENAWAAISLGVTCERKGDLQRAFREYLTALERDPRITAPYHYLDGIFRKPTRPDFGADLDRMAALVEKILGAGGDHPLVPDLLRMLVLALAETPRGDLDKAERFALLAVEKTNRTQPRMLAALARVLHARERGADAVLALEEALRLPHATRTDRQTLEEERKAILPALASFASIDAALAALDIEALVPEGAIWRFFKGEREPSGGLLWTQLGFDDADDAAWKSGPSGFGFADDDDATVLGDMKGGYSSLYLRHEFEVPDPSSTRRLILTVRVDDGFVAYLNGVEIERFGIEPDLAPVAFDARASIAATTEPCIPWAFPLDPKLLLAGKNMLAIQGLNHTLTSSDFTLIPVLAREVPPEAEKDRKLLEAFRAAGGGRLLPYLEGRVLQRAGKPGEAAARFTEALALDEAAHEPALRLAECLRAAGRPGNAEESLRRMLAGPRGARSEPWDLWLAISFLDLKRSPAEMLARLPGRGGYADDVRWLLETLEARVPVRIDCGAVEDRKGKGSKIWGRDRFFRSGCRFGEEMWNLVPASRLPPYPGEISGTEDDFIHQTERWFPTDENPPAGYEIPIPPGRYAVTLHFAELFYTKRGSRYFDILIEGRKVLGCYEPLAAGYTTADTRSFEVEVNDGALEIEFQAKAQFPKVSAIEIAAKE